jgi:hypothetical protein
MNETKEELQEQLRKIEAEEAQVKEDARKEENFKKFMERDVDWMIGRAHADLQYIGEKYYSDKKKALLPIAVRVSGNMGHTYQGEALITSATKTYFHNAWSTRYGDEGQAFQEKLNKLVQEEVNRICNTLPVMLEMMGLQSNHYWITAANFPEANLGIVRAEVEKAQAEILDKYPDDDFLALIKNQVGWVNGRTGEPVPEHSDINLSHSAMIVSRYVFKHRPTLQPEFAKCSFYESWRDRIEAQ